VPASHQRLKFSEFLADIIVRDIKLFTYLLTNRQLTTSDPSARFTGSLDLQILAQTCSTIRHCFVFDIGRRTTVGVACGLHLIMRNPVVRSYSYIAEPLTSKAMHF